MIISYNAVIIRVAKYKFKLTMVNTLKNWLHIVEKYIDGVTMYRTVLGALLFLAGYGLALGAIGILPYSFNEQLLALIAVLLVGAVSNYALSKGLGVVVNHESAIITSLILYFLVVPPFIGSWGPWLALLGATVIAMLSKFVVAWRRQHIVNPAAMGVVGVTFLYHWLPLPGYFEPTWWVGTPSMLPALILTGAIVVYKVRKWWPVLTFLAVAFMVYLFEAWRFGSELVAVAPAFWISGPTLFLAFFMLTEPFTLPPTKRLQTAYGASVGVLSQLTIFAPWFTMTPELALLLGNLMFYPSRLRQKLYLPLQKIRTLANDTYELVFSKPAGLTFQAGQYLEWTLPHQSPDSRGIRRYFTIASAPTESVVRLAVKHTSPSSSYKQALLAMQPEDTIIASQRAGDFTLPHNREAPLVAIAGGIGITPFRSQLRYMYDTEDSREVILFYCCNTVAELAYREELEAYADTLACTVIPIIAKEEQTQYEGGFLDVEIINKYLSLEQQVAAYWYISGPPGMVSAYRELLTKECRISKYRIVTDFFPGLA